MPSVRPSFRGCDRKATGAIAAVFNGADLARTWCHVQFSCHTCGLHNHNIRIVHKAAAGADAGPHLNNFNAVCPQRFARSSALHSKSRPNSARAALYVAWSSPQKFDAPRQRSEPNVSTTCRIKGAARGHGTGPGVLVRPLGCPNVIFAYTFGNCASGSTASTEVGMAPLIQPQ